jgi:hypothetical protein
MPFKVGDIVHWAYCYKITKLRPRQKNAQFGDIESIGADKVARQNYPLDSAHLSDCSTCQNRFQCYTTIQSVAEYA